MDGADVSEIGDWLYAVAIYSLLLEFTGQAKTVGLAVVFQVLPQLFVSPMAGAINDRLRRRSVMIFADVARSGITLAMLLVTSKAWLPFLYLLLALETVMWGFFEPARTAIIPALTRDDHEMVTANGLSSVTWAVNFFLGSSLGGVVAALFGRQTVFLVNAASFLVSAWLLRRIAVEEKHAEEHPPFRVRDLFDFRPVMEGMRYMRADAKRLTTLCVKGAMGWVGSNYVILTIMGERVFPLRVAGFSASEAGMLGMSFLMGARGVGAITGPLTAGAWAGASHARMRLGIGFGFLAVALGYGLLSVAPTAGIAFALVMLAHAGSSIVWVFSTTLLQFWTEDRYRGRVFSADFGMLVISISLSTTLAGLAVDSGVAVQWVALATGLLMLPAAAGWLWLTRGWKLSGGTLPPSPADAAAPPFGQ